MEDTIAVRVENVSKSFKVYSDKGVTLKEKLLFSRRRKYEKRDVLKGLSFSVRKGEAVGIIGQNGSGKSTLLKMLTRIMYPDSGTIETVGRVSALIELGAGFHPDMTGRENIYTNAAIFGLSRKEIDSRLPEIIRFSELGDYIDNPVRTYSSGMYMRLAFSVAVNVNADILLVDEILAVGDAAFQAKCFHKLREIKGKGTTIIIVSHALGQVEQFCDRSIWIKDGGIEKEGRPNDVHPDYLDFMGQQLSTIGEKEKTEEQEEIGEPGSDETEESLSFVPAEGEKQPEPPAKNRWGNGDARITRVRLLDETGTEQENFPTGGTMEIVMEYAVNRPLRNPACGIGIFRNDGVNCYGTNTQIDRLKLPELGKGGEIRFRMEKNLLLPGEYTLDAAIHTEDGFAYDYYRFAKRFRMYSSTQDVGVTRLEHVWNIKNAPDGSDAFHDRKETAEEA